MQWFEGSIPEAIQLAKTRRAVFIVYIEGTDDISKSVTEVWEAEATRVAFDKTDCVALKLAANSDACAQFSAIFPVVVIPSTFFIGNDGTPLEIMGGDTTSENLVQNIEKVVQLHESQQSPSAPTQEPSSSTTPSPSTPDSDTAPVVAEAGASSPEDSKDSVDARVARARTLLEQKRRDKEEQEKEALKQQEKERRELGKNVAQLKKKQEDDKYKEKANEWKKEKEEAKRHREEIKAQIARDREERHQKYQKEKSDREQAQTKVTEEKAQAQAEEKAQVDAVKRETARLQFRLPDGSSITEQFASSETLGAARSYLRAKIGNRYGSFSLSTHYPKQDFTEADMTSTLLDLQLAPSAVIIVVPSSKRSITPAGDGGGGNIFWMLLAPFLAIWNFLYSFLFASPPSQAQGPPPDQDDASASTQSPPQHTQPRQRPQSSYGIRSRQEGNIRRLTAEDKDDDDRITYNGNSTQQL